MISAVLDTNVLVSGIGWRGSAPSRILDELVAGSFIAVTSGSLLEELSRVLGYPRIRVAVPDARRVVSLIEDVSVVVEPVARLEVVVVEPDNRLLEVAVAAGANYVVTGDRALLELGGYEGTAIVSPRDFVALLE